MGIKVRRHKSYDKSNENKNSDVYLKGQTVNFNI